MRSAVVLLSFLIASTSLAQPLHREGANHHLGDDSFLVRFGRVPDAGDSEKLRMQTHLEYVRDLLASRAATAPVLAPRRADLLGYLGDYIRLGITPENRHLPWRTPVFIDDRGAICAVGYLIEQSVGRALPENIAHEHRYDTLEDIAAAMPEVATWIASSGFTLEELASIQPAYAEPAAETWRSWTAAKAEVPVDGAYDGRAGTGTFRNGRMEGTWTKRAETEDGTSETIVGSGELHRGAGTWTSFYADGTRRARGPFHGNRAHGVWTLFHPSGNVAAEGSFDRGDRAGTWRFYDDTPAKTPIAIGAFRAGHVTGTWRHFDRNGDLLAMTRTETPAQWGDDDLRVDGGEGFSLAVTPGRDGVAIQLHQGTVFGNPIELASYARGSDRIYVHTAFQRETIYDTDGHQLERDGSHGWRASRCRWSTRRKQIARAGDVARLHGVLYQDVHRRVGTIQMHGEVEADPGPSCDAPAIVSAQRARVIDELLATRDKVRAESPAFVRRAMLGTTAIDPDESEWERTRREDAVDLVRVLARNMGTYLEWPHIDGQFTELFATMPGRYTQNWFDGEARDYLVSADASR